MMLVRQQTQHVAFQRDAMFGQHARRRGQCKFRMTGEERLDDGIVFSGQQAASGINHTATRTHQFGGSIENGGLFDRQFDN